MYRIDSILNFELSLLDMVHGEVHLVHKVSHRYPRLVSQPEAERLQ